MSKDEFEAERPTYDDFLAGEKLLCSVKRAILLPPVDTTARIGQYMRRMVLEEREACARLVETAHNDVPGSPTFAECVAYIAAAIRGRG